MNIDDLVNLVHLRRYLYDVQNGHVSLPKEQLRGLNAKIRELDLFIVDQALTQPLTTTVKTTVPYTSSESDFEASTKMVLESRKAHAAQGPQPKAKIVDGMTVITAPADETSKTDTMAPVVADVPTDGLPTQQQVDVPKTKNALKAIPTAKKGVFARSDE